MCINFPWRKPKNLPKDEDPEAPQQVKGPPGAPKNGPDTTPAPVSLESVPNTTQTTCTGGGGPPSDTTFHGPAASAASAQPGQPANPVSASTQRPSPAEPAPNSKAPGPSYESDDEAEPLSAEARLNDITRSVKSHARAAGAGSADEFARRQAEAAAKRLAAAHGVVEEEAALQVEGEIQPATAADGGPAAATPPQPTNQLEPNTAAAAPPSVGAPGGAGPPAEPAAAPGAAAAANAAAVVRPPALPVAATLDGNAAVAADAAAAKLSQDPEDGAAAAAAPEGDGAALADLHGVESQGPQAVSEPVNAEAVGAEDAALDFEIDLDIDLTKGDLKVDYSARGLLGQGGFAAVYKGRYKGQRVAVKMIKKTAGSNLADLQEDMNTLMHELNILRQVNHPNIVTLYGGCLKPPHVFMVEERMEGSLDFYVHQVRKDDPLSVREVVYFALDMACGLSYLHPRIVHRDLKPANVLLSREGRCKISDFGLARTKIKEYLSTKNLDAGTTAYIAPECFMSMDNPDLHDLRRSVTDRTDVYALGVIMWEMLAGKRPWQGLKPLLVAYQVAYRSLRPPLFEVGSRCPARLRQLVEDCWCQEPQRRPSSQQVVDRLIEILNELPPEEEDGYGNLA